MLLADCIFNLIKTEHPYLLSIVEKGCTDVPFFG